MLEPNALLWDQGSQKDVLWCSSSASGAHASRSNTIDGVSMPYCMWRSWARFHLSSGGIVCGDDVATNKGSLPLLPRAGRVVVWPTWSKYKTRKNLQIQSARNDVWPTRELMRYEIFTEPTHGVRGGVEKETPKSTVYCTHEIQYGFLDSSLKVWDFSKIWLWQKCWNIFASWGRNIYISKQ